MKFLKNYTSTVPAHLTISRIEQLLVKMGTLNITKEYGPTGRVSALLFLIPILDKLTTIRMPAKVEEAQTALWENYMAQHTKPRAGLKMREDFAEQAERTAWKLAQDWTEVQFSMVALKQKEISEVFMADVWDGHQTFFQFVKGRGFKALTDKSL